MTVSGFFFGVFVLLVLIGWITEFDDPIEWLKAMAVMCIVLPAMVFGLLLLFFIIIF